MYDATDDPYTYENSTVPPGLARSAEETRHQDAL